MYKHAKAARPEYELFAHLGRFTVIAYLARPDNQGKTRIFRYRTLHASKREAVKLFDKRKAGRYLFGELFKTKSLDLLDQFGDSSVEDVWLDTKTSE